MVALILATAFFVAAEFAFVAVDRNRTEAKAAGGDKRAMRAEKVLRRLSFHLSGAQLGITVASLVLGFVAEPTVATLFEPVLGKGASVAAALLLVTLASMVASELVPKNLAIAQADRAAAALARPVLAYGVVFGPLIRLLNAAADVTVRRFGIEPLEELTAVRSLQELELLIRSSGEGGTLDADALTLLTRTIRFNDKTAADALVPRTSVTVVGPDDSIADLVTASVTTGFSRFPVCRDDLDDVVGTVHVKDVYRLPIEQRADAKVSAVMAEPFIVPESRDLGSVLVDLRTGNHLAVVVDEYGGTAGIITMEDVLEEIVGDIDDEYDRPKLTRVLPDGTYELPGSLHPDEVLDSCGYEVPEGEYETLAGFILQRLGRIPDVGDGFGHGGWLIEVVTMDRRRVALVRLRAPKRTTEVDA
ncbi:MAG: hemolysin family protein [Acidimicrobiales bacterium]